MNSNYRFESEVKEIFQKTKMKKREKTENWGLCPEYQTFNKQQFQKEKRKRKK